MFLERDGIGVCPRNWRTALWNPRNLLRGLVAGEGFTPNVLTLPFRIELVQPKRKTA